MKHSHENSGTCSRCDGPRAHIGAGERACIPNCANPFMVSQALTQLLSRPVAVAELFADDGFAEVGPVGIRTTRVADAFDGQVVELANLTALWAAARDHHAKMSADLASIPTAGKQPLELLMQIEKDSGEAGTAPQTRSGCARCI